jgi:hypothetical protein
MRLRGKRSSELLDRASVRDSERPPRGGLSFLLDEDQEMTFGGLPILAFFGPYAMSDLSPNYAPKRTSVDHAELTGSRPGPRPLAFHIPACAFAPDLPVGRRSRCRIQSFCPALCQKYFCFSEMQIRHISRPIPCPSGGALRIVTTLGAGSSGRERCRRRSASILADGEGVWS